MNQAYVDIEFRNGDRLTDGEGAMTKQDIIKTFKAATGAAFITRKQLADLMGIKDPHRVDRYLKGLDRIDRKYYFIPDVAESLLQGRRT